MITLISQFEEMLNELLDERDAQLLASKDKDAAIAACKDTINELLNSNSWKMTKPLRAIGRLRKQT